MLTRLARFLRAHYKRSCGQRELVKIASGQQGTGPQDFPVAEWKDSLSSPTEFYLDCVRYFYHSLPSQLREHRKYFCTNRRGFGEDAFHVMWLLLFREFRPSTFLEIGVYRGQTLSLASLLQKQLGIPGKVVGISPFQSAGDRVSKYREDVDYHADTLSNFAYFSLPVPELIPAFSTDAKATGRLSSEAWDLIYIDGNHDYEIARQDWDNSAAAIRPGGLIVLDDSGLETNYRPPSFATAGHPGPSKLAREIPRDQFREILQVGHNRVFQRI